MNTEEAIKEIEGTTLENRDAVSRVLAAGMVADATNRLAAAQEIIANVQKVQMEASLGMMGKLGPMLDKSLEALEREEEGEEWKNRGDKDED